MAYTPLLSKVLILKYAGNIVALTTDFEYEVKKSTVKVLTDASGGWTERLIDKKSWTISFSGLVNKSTDVNTGYADWHDLLSSFKSSDVAVTVIFGDNDGDFESGSGFLISLKETGSVGGNVTYTGSIIGTDIISTVDSTSMGLYGFGSDSLFAYELSPTTEPSIMVVDRLTASRTDGEADTTSGNNIDYRGSLAYCLAQSFPRIVLFEVSGTIDLRDTQYLFMASTINSTVGYCWVVGQSAPSPGIDVLGSTLWVAAVKDVLFQHMTFRLGDINTVHGAEDRDSVTVHGTYLTSRQIFFNRCSIAWCTDDVLDSKAHNLNVSECLIYEPLVNHNRAEKDNTFHPPIGIWEGTSFAYRNIFAFGYDRPPWAYPSQGNDSNQFAFINNIFWSTYRVGVNLGMAYDEASIGIEVSVIGNWVYKFKDYAGETFDDYTAIMRPVNNTSGLCKYYFAGNKSKRIDDAYSELDSIYDNTRSGLTALETSSPFDISDVPIIDVDDVPASVIASAGSKWRDAHDVRILTEVEDAVVDDRELLDSPQALPARAVNWYSSSGNVNTGFDYSTTPQGFTVAVNGGSALAVTLTANCADHAAVIAHINTRITAAGLSGVEAYEPSDITTDNQYVGLRTTTSGASTSLVVTSSTATSIDLLNGTYTGQDAFSGGYLTRANNSHEFTIPDNPHTMDGNLRVIEKWILETFSQDAVEI